MNKLLKIATITAALAMSGTGMAADHYCNPTVTLLDGTESAGNVVKMDESMAFAHERTAAYLKLEYFADFHCEHNPFMDLPVMADNPFIDLLDETENPFMDLNM